MFDFSKFKILVVGDIILDEYVYGTFTRMSPEAPIPLLNKTHKKHILGGASNVALNLTTLGAQTWIMGRIGNDFNGEIIKHLLSEKKINIDLLIKDKCVPTTTKTRFITNTQQLLRVDKEDTTPLNKTGHYEKILDLDLDRHLQYFDAVIISDYNKGVVFPELIQHICDINKKYQKILIADTKKKDLNLFKNFTALAPNRGEFEQMVNKTFKSISDLGFAAIKVTQTHNIQNMLVTLGDQGICCADENTFSVLPAEQKNVVDVTGCGDTVTAVYTLGLLQGLSMVSATKLANDAAGIVVTKFGTATVTPQELDNAN